MFTIVASLYLISDLKFGNWYGILSLDLQKQWKMETYQLPIEDLKNIHT